MVNFVNLTGFRITMETLLGVSMRHKKGLAKEGRLLPERGGHHSMGWDPRRNKRWTQAGHEHSCSCCFLTACTLWPAALFPSCCHEFPSKLDCRLRLSQRKPFLKPRLPATLSQCQEKEPIPQPKVGQPHPLWIPKSEEGWVHREHWDPARPCSRRNWNSYSWLKEM